MAPIRSAVRLHEMLCMLMPGKRLFASQQARVDLYVYILNQAFEPARRRTPTQIHVFTVILQADKFLKCDWLRPVVLKSNLKYLDVKITPVT